MQVWYFYFGIALVYMIFTLSLNLLLGYAGQVSAAHAAFGAVGGFLTGYLMQARHWNIVPAVSAGEECIAARAARGHSVKAVLRDAGRCI